ncbi:unnamed protein product [Tetraodon nigroviridis]|uniref:(spotted green pufferfish) hypothetical protein n=1 Tax=Tetraodon nigroviridis TaxID=99883 RepID=Q4SEK6_TETNG|nr:unnamed protein product [Tetraodon nigroviridis]
MPLRRCPCNDFTSTAALLDPDTPTQPSQRIPVPIGLLRTTAMAIRTERTETERVKTDGSGVWWWSSWGGAMKKGLCKRSTVGQRFLLACRREGT